MTAKTVPFHRNPLGVWVFGPQLVSLVGCDKTIAHSSSHGTRDPNPHVSTRATPHTSTTDCSEYSGKL
jgi:hypothetical protein